MAVGTVWAAVISVSGVSCMGVYRIKCTQSGCLPRVDVVPADFRRGLPCCRYRFLAGCSLLQVARHELLQNERSPPWVPESTVRIHLLHVRR